MASFTVLPKPSANVLLFVTISCFRHTNSYDVGASRPCLTPVEAHIHVSQMAFAWSCALSLSRVRIPCVFCDSLAY